MFTKLTQELTTIADLPDKPLEGPGAIGTQELKEKFEELLTDAIQAAVDCLEV